MVELSRKEEDEALKSAVRAAQKAAKKFGLDIGDVVAHPSDPHTYRLVDKIGDVLIVERPIDPKNQDGPKIKTTLPVIGTFDVSLLMHGGKYVGSQLLNKKIAKLN